MICQYKVGHKATHTHQMYQERDMEMALHCDMCTGMFELHLLGEKKNPFHATLKSAEREICGFGL